MKTNNTFLLLAIGTGIALAYCNHKALQRKPNIYYTKRLIGNYRARTIPPFGIWILEEHRYSKNLLDHELIHWRQYQQRGLFGFYSSYFSQFFRYGYDKMPMEKEARFIEDEYCKNNYRECIKRGVSRTIDG